MLLKTSAAFWKCHISLTVCSVQTFFDTFVISQLSLFLFQCSDNLGNFGIDDSVVRCHNALIFCCFPLLYHQGQRHESILISHIMLFAALPTQPKKNCMVNIQLEFIINLFFIHIAVSYLGYYFMLSDIYKCHLSH